MRVLIGPDAALGRQGVLISGKIDKKIVIDSLLPETIERFRGAGILAYAWCNRCGTHQARKEHTDLHQHPLADRALVSGAARRRARPCWPDRAASRLAGPRNARVRGGKASAVARCGRWCAPVRSISASTFARLNRCCRSVHPKALPASCSARGAAAISRARRAVSPWCRRMRWNWSRQRPRGRRPTRGTLSHARRSVVAALATWAQARHGDRSTLTQHLVTCALGGGFDADELRAEVEKSFNPQNLSDLEWQWALDFVVRGGASLSAYPDFHKVVFDEERDVTL